MMINTKKLGLVLIVLAAAQAFGEDDILPRPPRPRQPGNELAALIHDTRVGAPLTFKNLVVYPLTSAGQAARGYWTLDEALSKDVLKISEKGEGSVPELLVENRADEPIFLLAGEIVKGGKQNRVVSQDVLLPAHSGLISLGVFCVEQGRWTKSTAYFGAEKELAHSNLRQQLSAPTASQSAVWGEVARKAGAVAPNAAGGTHYLGRVFEEKDVQRDIAAYAKSIELPREATGMAVLLGGRVVGAELFGDAATFHKLCDKLVRSYAMDAIENSKEAIVADGRAVVERFLRRTENARLAAKETIGIGQFFKIEGGGLYGSLLQWHEQAGAHHVVHASLFDETPVVNQPPVNQRPRLVPFER